VTGRIEWAEEETTPVRSWRFHNYSSLPVNSSQSKKEAQNSDLTIEMTIVSHRLNQLQGKAGVPNPFGMSESASER
jgi:hypothetical protein